MSNELDLTSNDAMHWAEQLEKHLKAGVAPDADYLVGWFANYWAAVHDPLKRRIEELEAALQPSLPHEQQVPIVWARPEDIRKTMIAVIGERAEVAPDKEPGFTVPLYLNPAGRADGFVRVPVSLIESIRKTLPGCSNHGCAFANRQPGSVGTNGSCNCIGNASRSQLTVLNQRISMLLNAGKEGGA